MAAMVDMALRTAAEVVEGCFATVVPAVTLTFRLLVLMLQAQGVEYSRPLLTRCIPAGIAAEAAAATSSM